MLARLSLDRRCAVILLAAAMWTAPARGLDPAYTAADFPDVTFSPRIQEKAAELGHDPVKIFEFVRNEFGFEAYYGLMKGPEATLLSGAGNDYDLAALLVSLLRASGTPARFVRGKVRIPFDKAQGWIGMPTGGGMQAYLRATQPAAWASGTSPLAATFVNPPAGVELLHIWVEAYVPLGSYRGAGGTAGAASRGQAWVPLDPSFKLRDWNPDPGLPIGTPTLSMDYGTDGNGGYYTSVQPELPIEAFEDQIRAHLASTFDGSGPPTALDDVLFAGPIRQERPGVLPSALPYELSGVLVPVRSAGLVNLHRPPASGGVWYASLPDAGRDGAADYRYRRYIHLCKPNTGQCETRSTSDPNKVLEASDWSAAWEGKRLTIWFLPTAASQPNLKDIGYASCTGTNGQPIKTLPRVSYGGGLHTQSATEVNLCAPLELVLEVRDPPDRVDPTTGQHLGLWHRAGTNPPYLAQSDLLPPLDFDIKAGEIFVASFDEHGANPTRVAEAASTLSSLVEIWPLANDPAEGLAFIDVDRDGIKDAGEEYLSHNPAAEEVLTGSLLHLAHTWYWNEYRRAERRVAAIHHLLIGHAPGRGRVTSGREVEYLFDVPFALQPSNLVIDLGWLTPLFTRAGGAMLGPAFHGPELLAHQGSALEHAVWEEVVGVAAVSTVKGFQLGFELDEENQNIQIDLLTLDTPSEAIQVVQNRCSGSQCNVGKGLDFETYCTIRRSFNIGSAGPSNWQSQCGSSYPETTSQLRILNRSNINYHGYTGSVFARYTATSLTMGIALENGSVTTDFVRDYLTPDPIYLPDATAWIHETRASLDVVAGDPVSITHGSYSESHTDISLPGPGGMGLRLVRSYNSRLDFTGSLGHGWIHTFEQHLRVDAGGPEAGDETVVWVTEQATEEPWDDHGTTLTPQPWNHDALVRQGNGAYVLTTHAGTVYRFLPATGGRALLDRITDRNGNTLRCIYSDGRLASVEDAAERSLSFEYGFTYFFLPLDRIVDWTGRIWDYDVDGEQDLVSYTDPEGHTWTYSYYSGLVNDALNHNLNSLERPALRAGGARYGLTFSYYPNDTVYKHVDSLGRATRFSYNFFRKRTDVFQPDGGVETYFYDNSANITRYQSPEGRVTTYEFDAEKRERTREVDGVGFETLLSYDPDGNLATRTDRNGETEIWTYNAFGQPVTWTDRRENVKAWFYDPQGNLASETATLDGTPLTILRVHGYDSRGNRTSTVEHLEPGAPPRRPSSTTPPRSS